MCYVTDTEGVREEFRHAVARVSNHRTPGNSRKGLIPKIGFLSGCLCAKFVWMGPGLRSDFKNLSGCSDQGTFLPSSVQISGSSLSAGPNDVESF